MCINTWHLLQSQGAYLGGSGCTCLALEDRKPVSGLCVSRSAVASLQGAQWREHLLAAGGAITPCVSLPFVLYRAGPGADSPKW